MDGFHRICYTGVIELNHKHAMMKNALSRSATNASLLMMCARACAFVLCAVVFFASLNPSVAQAETRSLKLYYLHTGERAEITYKRNGRYIQSGLKKVNRFLRDWRRNEPTKMDPKLLDLVWEIYKESGSRKHIHVISGYRSLKTNNILRKRGRGVARKSQHTLGRALDFFLPDVKLSKLRRIALKKQRGGVGFYPRSGSPFVHVDTGRVRHWPKMSRKQLARIFPRGDTLHIPSDGKPLKGFKVAKARYQREQKKLGKIEIAKGDGRTFLERLAGRGDDDDEAENTPPTPRPVKTTRETANKPKIIPAGSRNPVVEPKAPAAPSVPATPDPGTIVVAAVEPKPAPETRESVADQLASVRVPVPTSAPRRTVNGVPIATPEPAQTIDNEPLADNGQRELAALIPVPIQRPVNRAVEPAVDPSVAIAALDAERPEAPATNEIALAARPAETGQPLSRVAALSPGEIENLRATAIDSTLSKLNSPDIKRPVPAVGVGENGAQAVQASKVPAPAVQSPAGQQVASIQPIEPSIRLNSGVAVPSPRPIPSGQLASASAQKRDRVKVASLREPEVPAVALAPEVEPTQNPASKAAKRLAEGVKKARETAKLSSRGRSSIDELDLADLEHKLTGNLSLRADATLDRLVEIRPPAYGRNAIRKPSSIVISAGFNTGPAPKANTFTGSSVEFLSSVKFETN